MNAFSGTVHLTGYRAIDDDDDNDDEDDMEGLLEEDSSAISESESDIDADSKITPTRHCGLTLVCLPVSLLNNHLYSTVPQPKKSKLALPSAARLAAASYDEVDSEDDNDDDDEFDEDDSDDGVDGFFDHVR